VIQEDQPMPTPRDKCPNYEINIQMCPCTNEDCANRGICCECLLAHASSGSKSACMRGVERRPETMVLASQAATTCATNQTRNLETCVCSYEPCQNKGVCCNCVRNHFTTDGTGRVSCMR